MAIIMILLSLMISPPPPAENIVLILSLNGHVFIRNHPEREESVKVLELRAPFYPGPADGQSYILIFV